MYASLKIVTTSVVRVGMNWDKLSARAMELKSRPKTTFVYFKVVLYRLQSCYRIVEILLRPLWGKHCGTTTPID